MSTKHLASNVVRRADPVALAGVLAEGRTGLREDPGGTLELAIACQADATALGDDALAARALALQGQVALHRGDVRGSLALTLEAERLLGAGGDSVAQAEVAALRAQASFFTGAYSQALTAAERAIEFADAVDDIKLRIFARRAAFMVLGNINVRELDLRLEELLELTVQAGEVWEEALTHNDIACHLEGAGEIDAARREIERAFELAESVTPNRFALAVIHSTRADIELRADNPELALAAAERSLALLAEHDEPNPYVLGASVRAQVQAGIALGQHEDAQQAGRAALEWLGERMPHTRSVILAAVAEALRGAGRLEEAYDALSRSAQLERQAFTEISELQLSLERAVLQARLARRESDALRDEAERDWLTGVYNRRFLARELAQPSTARFGHVVSVAVIDLDHFKEINDRYGHGVGDQVLVRAAELLRDVLRGSDIVVRSGGEEFLVLMPFTDASSARGCGERVREAIRDEQWERIGPDLRLTTSVGVATAEGPHELEALVHLADGRLYEAKRAGRDRVIADPVADPDADPDTDPDAGPDTDPDAGPDTDPDAGPDTDPDAGPDIDPDIDPDAEAGPVAVADSDQD